MFAISSRCIYLLQQRLPSLREILTQAEWCPQQIHTERHSPACQPPTPTTLKGVNGPFRGSLGSVWKIGRKTGCREGTIKQSSVFFSCSVPYAEAENYFDAGWQRLKPSPLCLLILRKKIKVKITFWIHILLKFCCVNILANRKRT